MTTDGKCRFSGGRRAHANRDWWPNQLKLQVLNQHSPKGNPMGEAFDYAEKFKAFDLDAVINLFIRMAWPGAGTYGIADGRGGAGCSQQLFAQLNCPVGP